MVLINPEKLSKSLLMDLYIAAGWSDTDEYPVPILLGWLTDIYNVDVKWPSELPDYDEWIDVELSVWLFSQEKYTEFCLRWL